MEVGFGSPPVPRGLGLVPCIECAPEDAVTGRLRLQHFAVVALLGWSCVHSLRDGPGCHRQQSVYQT